jgi:hypothetical protein
MIGDRPCGLILANSDVVKRNGALAKFVVPGLVPGIHVFLA